MKKWMPLVAVFAFAIAVLYALTFFFIIPKTAEASVPFKWRNVITGLSRQQYKAYLGRPAHRGTSAKADKWFARSGNYSFLLSVQYNADTIAEKMHIQYTFSNSLFYKTGEVNNKAEE